MFVFRADSLTAHRRALDHPAVKAGDLIVEMHPWYAAYGTLPGDTMHGSKQRGVAASGALPPRMVSG